MKHLGPGLRAIFEINFRFLSAAFLAALALICWPETAEGWRSGLFAITVGLGALGLVIKNFVVIIGRLLADGRVKDFNRTGRAPRADEFADARAMRKSGMIE